MNISALCIFLTCLIPTVCAGIAKMTGGFKMSHNAHPRDFLAGLTGKSARANAAQMNGWEAVPQFSAAILAALYFCGKAPLIDNIAIVFVISRVLYSAAYIANFSRTRTSLFFLSTGCIWYLFYLAVTA